MGGRQFSFKDIEYLKLTREISGLPVKGIITARLNAKIHTDEPFSPGAEIHLYNSFGEEMLPVFYLSKPGFADGAAEITAYDNCRALDRIFDTSAYFSEGNDYPVTAVISAVASQCGFGGAVNFETAVNVIPYKYLVGNTCRNILEILSQAACGTWFCNNINQLEFKKFGLVTDYCTLNENNCSEFRRGSVKGPISALQVHNPITDEDYELGYYSSFINKLKVSGKLIDSTAAHDILENVEGKEYRAFSCKKAETLIIPNALCGFLYKDIMYRASSIVTDITPSGFFSAVRSPVISEDRFDYVGTLEYSVADRIQQEKKYGSSVMSFSGLKFADDNDSYGFSTSSGGMTFFDGVMSSKKPAEKVTVNKTAGTVTVNYTDGHKYTYSAGVKETADGYEITEESEEWE